MVYCNGDYQRKRLTYVQQLHLYQYDKPSFSPNGLHHYIQLHYPGFVSASLVTILSFLQLYGTEAALVTSLTSGWTVLLINLNSCYAVIVRLS